MELPAFIRALPQLDAPVDPDIVETRALASPDGLGVFFIFHQDFTLPPHHHKAQWGTVLCGDFELTIDGDARAYAPGESYSIPSGAVHSARARAGAIVFDVFEEPDRYGLRA
jgi:quercetin dioxygenase-like cupin family protein